MNNKILLGFLVIAGLTVTWYGSREYTIHNLAEASCTELGRKLAKAGMQSEFPMEECMAEGTKGIKEYLNGTAN